jgi:hypothetical protein
MAEPVTDGHDDEEREAAGAPVSPPAGVGHKALTDEEPAPSPQTDADASTNTKHPQPALPAEPSPQADAPTDAAPTEPAPPKVYAPDPAGTRPKVPAAALASNVPASSQSIGSLGQTFRPPTGGSPTVAVAPTAVAAKADDEDRPPVESAHAPRFQFILGALLALGLSAIAITAYTFGSGRDPLPTDWSLWHPTASGIAAATQIANHVAAEYRQPGAAGQLLAVQGGPLAFDGVPVTAIALKTGGGAGGVSVLAGSAVLYKMCGLGPSCSIAGKASAERLTLVRREALELALYTFQYVGGANQVVVFLPPVLHPAAVPGQPKKIKVTTDPTDAVFFKASDLAGELSHPLTSTLTQVAPSVSTVATAPDTPAVEELTSPSFYKFSFEQTTQDASLFLVLEPFAVGN